MNSAQILPLADTWPHGGWGWGGMTLMMVLMVLFWGAVIFGLVWLIRGAFDGRSGGQEETPIEVLDRRFAEGAISVEDYRAGREVLGNGTAEPGAEGGGPGQVATGASRRLPIPSASSSSGARASTSPSTGRARTGEHTG